MNYEVQTAYQKAILFAAGKHALTAQKLTGTEIPYVVHLSNVAMEILLASFHENRFNLQLSMQVASLHDVLEDTKTSEKEIEKEFGIDVKNGVKALTKNKDLTGKSKTMDSLERIKLLQKEIWAVKLADRITNLQKPPESWPKSKCMEYLEEANLIYESLKEGNHFLAQRLKIKIEEYRKYLM